MNQAHLDMDDCADFAVGPMQSLLRDEGLRREHEEAEHLERERLAYLSRDYGPKDRAEGAVYAVYAPQGRAEQGWRVRNSAEPMPVVIDRLPEDYDDQSESADAQVLLWLLKGFVIVTAALLCAWVIAGGLAHV